MGLKAQELMGVVMVLMVMVCGGGASSTCANTLMGLASCLNFVVGNSSTPSPACCLQLSTVVQTQPRCLCTLLTDNIGLTINQTLAVTLPGACRVQTPPMDLCNGGPETTPAPKHGSESRNNNGSKYGAPTYFLLFLLFFGMKL